MTPTRILLIEDQPDLRADLQRSLELEGFEVDTAGDGKQGLRKALNDDPGLILLDLVLPELSGIEVLRRLRQAGRPTPVIIVSARSQEHDKVVGLELGADDYITKPFAVSEVMARIRAVLRRALKWQQPVTPKSSEPTPVLCYDGLTVDFRRFTVTRDGVEHQLSRYEAEILRKLIQRHGEVVSRQDLLRDVWGYVHLPTTRTVDNHIARLRKKVERDVDRPRHVVTVHGLGYRFDAVPLVPGGA